MTTVREVMMTEPIVLDARQSVREAARLMRDNDIGDVLVRDEGDVCGILTDRDIVVRGLADDLQPVEDIKVGDICSRATSVVEAAADINEAARIMRDAAVRRLPVVEDGEVIGIVSLGDLAMERDPASVLADISAAPADG